MKFFSDGGKKVQADAASRKSGVSKISSQFKDRFIKKVEDEVPAADPPMEKVEEIIYESELDKEE